MICLTYRTEAEKRHWLNQGVRELLYLTYNDLGGLKNLDDYHLDQTPGSWKIISRDNDIPVAGIIYRDHLGNKVRLVFHDGTPEAKEQLKAMLAYDLGRDAWVEASGPLAKFLLSIRVRTLGPGMAECIFNVNVNRVGDAGFYTRIIDGVESKPQMIFGYPYPYHNTPDVE